MYIRLILILKNNYYYEVSVNKFDFQTIGNLSLVEHLHNTEILQSEKHPVPHYITEKRGKRVQKHPFFLEIMVFLKLWVSFRSTRVGTITTNLIDELFLRNYQSLNFKIVIT